MWLFCRFKFERNYDVLKSKNPCFSLSKNINFNKNETHIHFQRDEPCALVHMRALKRNKSAFYVNVQGIFFNICVLSQCTVYRRNFQNMDKVFKSGLRNFFKGCLPQNLLSPLLNTLSHIYFYISKSITFVSCFQNCRKPSVYP